MDNVSKLCTCKDLDCALHPTKHDKGCTPCIMKNLKTREMPGCFFNLTEGAESRSGDSFEDFAKLILSKDPERSNL